ncbi:RNA methyltransferase [Clostridium sardiniense]|uniref:RNA methyltransferase n=1 Tax=Clostridium sardiniense TaxID=29369 RepID=A0ABS7KW36_CLOSR|nr:RNA methyltransferase [Clostridium sardiniense]MBY0754887.1 RNA methyltransferase [Clostridium sardiniense]MDQ0461824.1 TrmH family RNA methyltransferase [Clostridium sardiniense]
MIYIESKDNAIYKETKKLKDRRNRNKQKKYLIEGFRLVEEALKAGANIETIFCFDELESKITELIEKYNYSGKIFKLNRSLFLEICGTENPQGILAVVLMDSNDKLLNGEFYLLCDKVQDPGNLGTIIRTAHAAGIDGIILTKGTVDIYNDKTIRSTMGSMFYIPIIQDDDFSIINDLKERGFSLVATSLEGKNDFFDEDLTGKIVITVGNEGNGVSDEIYNISDKKVKIPMPGGAESLNVGVATSIILYERVRQIRRLL